MSKTTNWHQFFTKVFNKKSLLFDINYFVMTKLLSPMEIYVYIYLYRLPRSIVLIKLVLLSTLIAICVPNISKHIFLTYFFTFIYRKLTFSISQPIFLALQCS